MTSTEHVQNMVDANFNESASLRTLMNGCPHTSFKESGILWNGLKFQWLITKPSGDLSALKERLWLPACPACHPEMVQLLGMSFEDLCRELRPPFLPEEQVWCRESFRKWY